MLPTTTALSGRDGEHLDHQELVDRNNNDQIGGDSQGNDSDNYKGEGVDGGPHSRSVDVRHTSGTASAKYQLRPRSGQSHRRYDCEWSLHETLRHKPRPPPLSRYRRKTANARERYRMRQINTAFESLRCVLPSWVCRRRAAADMTKITTLRLASAYIRSLQDILDGNAHQDTCSWVLSSLLQEAPSPKKPRLEHNFNNTDGPADPPTTPTEPHLVSLLCETSGTGILEDSLSFSYPSVASEAEGVTLLLGCDVPAPAWTTLHTSLVT
ncbi:uncharacterized protein LOC121876191 [Homarus americanus]|uniref:uncharacterized protein LOC121876191 n=1 Tax=Homarus americanus TaxID=6706 RepID=UPI001C4675F9|nr:uncharacterized protein LOC121876191 [Homarus americanus]XP_042237091.1 uncharacterized protein LOC121876191 [Homarus americanus]